MDTTLTDAELGRLEAEADDDCALEEPHDEEAPPPCSCGLDEAGGAG